LVVVVVVVVVVMVVVAAVVVVVVTLLPCGAPCGAAHQLVPQLCHRRRCVECGRLLTSWLATHLWTRGRLTTVVAALQRCFEAV
jgi:hypothetical protein